MQQTCQSGAAVNYRKPLPLECRQQFERVAAEIFRLGHGGEDRVVEALLVESELAERLFCIHGGFQNDVAEFAGADVVRAASLLTSTGWTPHGA